VIGDNQPVRKRVIVGATCFADADAAIEMAAKLARKVEADVLGLLVEDDAIVRYARSPSAKTLTFQRGSRQHVTPKTMGRAFQRDARVFEHRLSSAARQAAVRWSFERQRGHIIPLLHSVAVAGDFIFLGYQKTPLARGQIVFIDHGGKGEGQLFNLSKEIAQEMGLALQTIHLSKSEKPPSRADSDLFSMALNASEQEMLDYLRTASPTAVIVAISPQHHFDLDEMLKAARCSVILAVQA